MSLCSKALPALLLCLLATSLPVMAATAPDGLPAKAWVLMDLDSGRVLAAKNADEQRQPASLAKLMLLYLAFESLEQKRLKIDQPVRVSEAATQAPGTRGARLFLQPGEHISVNNLITGIAVASANDAAAVLADALTSENGDALAQMNQKAVALGMGNTHFANVTGLFDKAQHSSAADLATLGRSLLNDFPDHRALFRQRRFDYKELQHFNRNGLLWREDSGVDGLKTGYIRPAGYCLMASAQRNGMRLLAVVLGAAGIDSRQQAASRLLEYGFEHYETLPVYTADTTTTTVPVWLGEQDQLAAGVRHNLYVTIPRGARSRLKAQVTVSEAPRAPVARHQTLGTVVVSLDDKTLQQVPLVALQPVAAGNIVSRSFDRLRLWWRED